MPDPTIPDAALEAACRAAGIAPGTWGEKRMRAALLAYERAVWRTLDDCPSDDISVWVLRSDGLALMAMADGEWWRTQVAGLYTHWCPARAPLPPAPEPAP